MAAFALASLCNAVGIASWQLSQTGMIVTATPLEERTALFFTAIAGNLFKGTGKRRHQQGQPAEGHRHAQQTKAAAGAPAALFQAMGSSKGQPRSCSND